MIGRQVILTNKGFTLDELERFMNEHWNQAECGSFTRGKPTPLAVGEYILLPATEHFMVIVYARKAGGFFSRKDKVVLSVCDSQSGVLDKGQASTELFGKKKLKLIEKERKGPAEDVLKGYAQIMRRLLDEAGFLSA